MSGTAASSPDPSPTGPQVTVRAAVPAEPAPAGEPAPGAAAAAEATGADPALRAPRRWPGLPRVRRWAARSGLALAAWARRPSGRLVLPGLLILVLVAATGTAGAYLVPTADRPAGAPAPQEPADAAPTTQAPVPPPAVPPPTLLPAPSGQASPGRPSDVLAGWAQQMSARTQIPPVAMQAYGYAEWVLTQQQPGCHLSWTTLAAIGKVESNHGSAGSATLTPDGRAYPPIYGEALDGQGGRRLIRDTDAGGLDKDTVYDRAIGPMQFIPQTWLQYQVDADDNGAKDPHDVDDSTLAAAGYLCAGGRDLATTDGWWQAVLAYNALRPYAEAVFAAANDYGRLSLDTP